MPVSHLSGGSPVNSRPVQGGFRSRLLAGAFAHGDLGPHVDLAGRVPGAQLPRPGLVWWLSVFQETLANVSVRCNIIKG